jgi:hypothetical protein
MRIHRRFEKGCQLPVLRAQQMKEGRGVKTGDPKGELWRSILVVC